MCARIFALTFHTSSHIVALFRCVHNFGDRPGLTGHSGTASIEAKITDAELNILLVAAVDRRSGRLFSSEGTALEESFQYWASMLRYRLCQWRGQQSCVKPKA